MHNKSGLYPHAFVSEKVDDVAEQLRTHCPRLGAMTRCWSIRVFEFGSLNQAMNPEDAGRATNRARNFQCGIVAKLVDPFIPVNPVDPIASVAAMPCVMAYNAQSEAGRDFDLGNSDFNSFQSNRGRDSFDMFPDDGWR
jgi:hypothetical protein